MTSGSKDLCNCIGGACMGDLLPAVKLCRRYGIIEDASPISPKNEQIGGNHYKDMPIQPIEYILANGLGYCEGNVIKYVSRYKFKNGVEDLKKARHYLDLLIEAQDDGGDNGA